MFLCLKKGFTPEQNVHLTFEMMAPAAVPLCLLCSKCGHRCPRPGRSLPDWEVVFNNEVLAANWGSMRDFSYTSSSEESPLSVRHKTAANSWSKELALPTWDVCFIQRFFPRSLKIFLSFLDTAYGMTVVPSALPLLKPCRSGDVVRASSGCFDERPAWVVTSCQGFLEMLTLLVLGLGAGWHIFSLVA